MTSMSRVHSRFRTVISLLVIVMLGRFSLRHWHRPFPFKIRTFNVSVDDQKSRASVVRFNLVTAGVCKPKAGSTAKYGTCGEDSYVITPGEALPAHRTLLAVADGVGGWIDHGGDSSRVSNGFMLAMGELHRRSEHWTGLPSLIKASFEQLILAKNFSKGTTTICSAAFDHIEGELEVSNIGDSQLIVIRNGQAILEVEAGVWAFNSPNQVGFGLYGEPQGDIDDMNIEKRLQLISGDVVVIGSDGLFDNVFVEEMVRIVEKSLSGKSATAAAMESAANALLKEAHRNGLNETFLSPFAREAIAARKAPSNYRGGKPDDISIIVAQVVRV